MASMSHSPASSTDAHSDVESPRLTKPNPSALAHTPQLHPKVKHQRSSSINSLTSTHSTHQRSLSLVSLESPRNSIVSIDDVFIRPTRNNSSSSLASLGGAGSPKELPKDNISLLSRLPKGKYKSSCVILSDEEVSESEHHATRSIGLRRKSSDKKQKPTFLSSLKKDFKFRYDHELKLKHSLANNSTLTTRITEDSHPSPLSLSVEGTQDIATPINILEEEVSTIPHRSSTQGKKVRSSSMTQSMFLKKKFLFSKDIQLELLSGHQSNFLSPTAAVPDTRYPFPSLKLPMPIQNFFPSHGNEPISQQHLPQLGIHSSSNNSSIKQPLSISRPISPSATSQVDSIQANELSVREQNKLLSQLNRKWNKAIFTASSDCELGDSIFNSAMSTKKRSRSELVSSTDSFSVASAK